MKRLMLVSPYLQFMIATNLVINMFDKDDVTDLLIIDDAPIYKQVEERARETKLFRNVGIAMMLTHFQNIHNVSKAREKLDLVKMTLLDTENTYLGNVFYPDAYDYDEVWFYDFQWHFYGLIDILHKHHCDPKFIRFDEAMFSSASPVFNPGHLGPKYRFMRKLRSIKGMRNPDEIVNDYYYFFKEALGKNVVDNYNIHKMPLFNRNDDKLKSICNYVFNIDEKTCECRQKYLYFASGFEIDKYTIHETELILKIAEIVGKDNLIVKQHPRDNRTTLSDAGITVMKNTTAPWEAIAMNMNLDNKCMLNLNSSSVSQSSALLDLTNPSLFLMELLRGQDPKIDKYWNDTKRMLLNLKENGICTNCHIIESMYELNKWLIDFNNAT